MDFNFVDVITAIAVVAIGAALAYLITVVASYFKSKKEEIKSYIEANCSYMQNEKVNNAFEQLLDIVDRVVAAMNDKYKPELIKATADGKLTDEEKKLLRDKALELIQAEVAEPVKELVTEVVGDFTEYVKTLIENAVSAAKVKTNKAALPNKSQTKVQTAKSTNNSKASKPSATSASKKAE